MDKIILKILKKLEKNGYSAFIVGGYVRDKLLGKDSSDVDICTNALPKNVIEIFNLDRSTKDEYGSVNIKTKKYNIDITTFRIESDYKNHTPKSVNYVNDLKTDLKRRDFTINSLVINSNEEIIDYYNGLKDLGNKKIKCIGSTKIRLSEDPLRMLRAIRFSIIYDFEIDDEIIRFIESNKVLIEDISYFRKKGELDKILSSNNRIKGLNLIKQLNLCSVLGIEYDNIINCKDIFGMYAQIKFSDKYQLTKNEKEIIESIREVLCIGKVNNHTLYNYGLYVNSIAGEILGIDSVDINRSYKNLPIKSRKDIKITIESIVKLNNNCYNGVNDIYKELETNILSGKVKNNSKDIAKFIRK